MVVIKLNFSGGPWKKFINLNIGLRFEQVGEYFIESSFSGDSDDIFVLVIRSGGIYVGWRRRLNYLLGVNKREQ